MIPHALLSCPLACAARSVSTAGRTSLLSSSHSLASMVDAQMMICSSSSLQHSEQASTSGREDAASHSNAWLFRSVKQKGGESFTDVLARRQKAWYAKLTGWEKAYLAAGAIGGGIYAYSKIDWDGSKAAAEEEKRAKEAKLKEDRLKALPAYLQGKSFVDEEESPLEGASPAEIEDLAKAVRVAAPAPQIAFSAQWAKGPLEEDPYEGMSPEEIDAFYEKRGSR